MRRRLRDFWLLIKESGMRWYRVDAMRLGAALAFYTMLSLSPMLVIVIGVAGLVFGQQAAQGQLVLQIQGLAGPQGAHTIQDLLAHNYQPATGILATMVGVVMLLVGATGVFAELHEALNIIWGVKDTETNGLVDLVRERFLSFAMVLALGFLLIVSLVISAALAALGKYIGGLWPDFSVVLEGFNSVFSLAMFALLFAMLFKWVPDVKLGWRDVWVGGLVTAVLFTAGKSLIGVYLGSSSLGSVYGAAGSFVVFLVWVYYSAQILFYGAEFTQVYAERFGSRLVPPREQAKPALDLSERQQGALRRLKAQSAEGAAP